MPSVVDEGYTSYATTLTQSGGLMAEKRLVTLSTMATYMLSDFIDPDRQERDQLARTLLQPQPGDAAEVFTEEMAVHLEPRYQALWNSQPMAPGPSRPGQTQLSIVATWSQDLAEASDQPGFLTGLAPHLKPGFAWFSWRYHKPGEVVGNAFEGLVWLGSKWAWFPRALRVAQMPEAH